MLKFFIIGPCFKKLFKIKVARDTQHQIFTLHTKQKILFDGEHNDKAERCWGSENQRLLTWNFYTLQSFSRAIRILQFTSNANTEFHAGLIVIIFWICWTERLIFIDCIIQVVTVNDRISGDVACWGLYCLNCGGSFSTPITLRVVAVFAAFQWPAVSAVSGLRQRVRTQEVHTRQVRAVR